MNTPICDFVSGYARENPLRLHMPGHKGQPFLGMESQDVTEVDGADVLYHAQGIIRQSQENAAALFGSGRTLYSTEGSSLCIRAMVFLALLQAKQQGKPCRIAAFRNVHKVFLSAAALLDVEISWIYPQAGESMLRIALTAEQLKAHLHSNPGCTAVYVTSPDYLGGMADVAALAKVCKEENVLLLVDNAHGAYLRFMPRSLHPMDLGADMCCDSAHKTLPVLTGGAYLHISKNAPGLLHRQAERAMAMFASTSPSYLILQSLDGVNPVLAGRFRGEVAEIAESVATFRQKMEHKGWHFVGDEPMKLTICPKPRGYTGDALGGKLRQRGIECEFADPDYLVLMFSPSVPGDTFRRLEAALDAVEPLPPITQGSAEISVAEIVCSPREAMLSPGEEVPIREALGRVLCDATVSCPPAIPVAVCGERLDENAIARLEYYGISHCRVMKESHQE